MDFYQLEKDIKSAKEFLKKENFFEKLVKLKTKSESPNFWDNPKEAQKVSSEIAVLEKTIKTWEEIEITQNNLEEMKEILSEIEMIKEHEDLSNRIKKAKLELFLSNEFDDNNAIITLTVGAGGVDASDWTKMVMSMLLKYCERKEWKTKILDIQDAEIAGIKGATIHVFSGEKIYGYLKSENGAHRLVRRSPFNTTNTRETSFANVEIVPEIDVKEELIIDEKDLKIDTFRAQGAGGQHVNTTDSAVRITHIPSGIVVQCQNERSQHQNKEQAMKVLHSRLAEKQRIETEAKKNILKSEKRHSSFGGGHIRSYVLDDRYVKDVRTGIKTSQVDKVLEGDIDEFVEAFVMMKL